MWVLPKRKWARAFWIKDYNDPNFGKLVKRVRDGGHFAIVLAMRSNSDGSGTTITMHTDKPQTQSYVMSMFLKGQFFNLVKSAVKELDNKDEVESDIELTKIKGG